MRARDLHRVPSAVMARVLTPARGANSSCVKPARRRWRRSRSAKSGATPAPVSLARPLPLMVMAVGSPSSSPRRPVGACSWSLILSYFATSHKTRPMRCIRGAATASMVARMGERASPRKVRKVSVGYNILPSSMSAIVSFLRGVRAHIRANLGSEGRITGPERKSSRTHRENSGAHTGEPNEHNDGQRRDD